MTPKDFQKILDTLKKLFRLSASANIHEADLARAKAEEIMAKYNVSDVDLADVHIEDIIEIDIDLAMRSNTPSLLFAKWCGNAFNVKAIQVGKTDNRDKVIWKVVRFIGTTADVAVATYVYSYVHAMLQMKTEEYYLSIKDSKSKWTPSAAKKVKNDFSFGFADAVCVKLEAIAAANAAKAAEEEAQAQGNLNMLAIGTTALAIRKHDLIEQYISDKYGATSGPDQQRISFDANHFAHGQTAGAKVGIHRGVGTNSNDKKQIGR